jgi:hypothetical protein
MTDLTAAQREDFLAASGYDNCCGEPNRTEALEAAQFGVHHIVQTHETLADFEASRGNASVVQTPAGALYIWKNVQMIARTPRGTLFAMFFDGVAASVFTG